MPGYLKRLFKQNTRNIIFRKLSRFGLAINRLYENRNYDIHSNGELRILKNLCIINPRVILDVGASNGSYSMEAHRLYSDCDIHCFEPEAESFNKLSTLFQSNTRIHPRMVGLSDTNGQQTFFNFGESDHTSLIDLSTMDRSVVSTFERETITGDHYMADHQIDKIDFLKIDVEGAEFKVLKGFNETFRRKRIRACQFEYGYANIITRTLLIDYYQFFKSVGYLVGKIYPKKVDFRPYNVRKENFLGPNYVAVIENEKELIKALSQ